MFAYDLVSNETPEVRLTDKCGKVLTWMDEYDVLHLPVFDDHKFQGLISQSALQNEDEETVVGDVKNVLLDIRIDDKSHLMDIVRLMNGASLSLTPIFTEKMDFLGVVRYVDIIKALGSSAAANQPGAILELEMVNSDYSMSDISRIIEGNDAKILYSNIVRLPDSKHIKLYLKLNVLDISGVLQTFSRYDYKVKSSALFNDYEDDMKDRYDSLMNYINM